MSTRPSANTSTMVLVVLAVAACGGENTNVLPAQPAPSNPQSSPTAPPGPSTLEAGRAAAQAELAGAATARAVAEFACSPEKVTAREMRQIPHATRYRVSACGHETAYACFWEHGYSRYSNSDRGGIESSTAMCVREPVDPTDP